MVLDFFPDRVPSVYPQVPQIPEISLLKSSQQSPYMSFNSDFEIILDGDVLSETWVPPTIPAREPHLRELERCVSPAVRGEKPLSAWLHGSPGTGKTTVSCHVLSELNKRTGIGGIYVNCWKHNTFYSVLEFMVNEMRRGFGDARDKAVKLGQFEGLVKDRPFLIVLDEIDLVPSRERNTMIYNLFSVGKVGLICISESRYPILALEERIRSRLNPHIVGFEPYSVQELAEILKERAAKGLHPCLRGDIRSERAQPTLICPRFLMCCRKCFVRRL